MRGDVGEVVVMCGGCFFCCVRVDVRFVLSRVWAWADFVMCDRRGGFMCALFACIACIFFIVGVQAQRAARKRRIMYIMYSLVLWWVAGAVFLVAEILFVALGK